MGHVWADVEVCEPYTSKCERVRALVDTGATLSVIPRDLAEKLGMKPVRVDTVETGAGLLKIERGVGAIRVGDREVITEVWISDVIDKVLIGSTTLEMLGLRVDPRTGRLEPAPLLLY